MWGESPNKYHLLQLLMALVAGMSSLAPGMSMGFSAVALPDLRQRSSTNPGGSTPLHPSSDIDAAHANATGITLILEWVRATGNLTLSDEESAWFMSIAMATTPLGCFISGYLNDWIGRKGALLSIAFPGIVGWLLLATVPTFAPQGDAGGASMAVFSQMIVGRALNGIAIGMASSPSSVFCSETTSPRFRGAVLCLNSLFISLGVLLVYFLGDVASGWRMIAAFGGILTGLVAFLSTMLPESPVWLRSKGRYGDADWVCYRLGLKTMGTTNEDKEGCSSQESLGSSDGLTDSILLLLERRTLRPLLILGGLFLLQQASGIFVVTFNAVEIAAASGISGAIVNSRMTAVLIGTCNIVGLALVTIFIDKLGRRPAAIFSASVMSFAMAALGIYVQTVGPEYPHSGKHYPFWTKLSNCSSFFHGNFSDDGYETISNATGTPGEGFPIHESPWHSWIPLAALLTWAFSSSLGLMPLPWALPPELLPAKTRSVGYGILSAFAYTCAFVALRVFSSLVVPLGLPMCMYIMSASAAAAAVYVAALVPETKGIPLDGLEERGGRWKEVLASVNTTPATEGPPPANHDEETLVYG